jgi:two-component system, OmpR family, sensor histidine kinase KdpD
MLYRVQACVNSLDSRFGHGAARHVAALLASAGAVALVTGGIFALDSVAPVLSLGVLYVFAVLPVAVLFGLGYALLVSVASMLAFNWFFLPPTHTFELSDGENWIALAVYLVTGLVVSALAARSRARATEAERRALEASLLAEVAGALLESEHVQNELRGISNRVAEALGVARARIELDSVRSPEAGESALELRAGERSVGRMFVESEPDPEIAGRISTSLASLLAVALDRERLGRRAVEAEALRRSDAIKTAILRAVSHDLRSPLTAIRTATDGLESAALELSESDRADLLATIDMETRRLDQLVANLLDLSRLELGVAEPKPELWTVESLVGQALNELGARAERVDVVLAPDLRPIEVDGAQIERVLVNLIDNALKFSPDAPVELVGEQLNGEAVVRVVDHGPGLSDGELEQIFEPFEQGRVPSRGSGLGLAIAKGFAQANGARLEAESSQNGGASFVLSLPSGR